MRWRRYGWSSLALLALTLLLAGPLRYVAAQTVSALNYFAQCAAGASTCDNVLNLDGTLEFEDKATNIDHGSQAVTGYATLTTNLTGIVDCNLTLKGAAGGATTPALDPVHVRAVTTTGSAVLDIHVWKATSSSDPTLIRSTTAATVGYVCFGSD